MVHTIVRPVLTMFRTVRITMAAALASSPVPQESGFGMQRLEFGVCQTVHSSMCQRVMHCAQHKARCHA